jgi:hypothetical protein
MGYVTPYATSSLFDDPGHIGISNITGEVFVVNTGTVGSLLIVTAPDTPPGSKNGTLKQLLIGGGIGFVVLTLLCMGCKQYLGKPGEMDSAGAKAALLSKEAKAVQATKKRFGQLNADGIIIPFQHLTFKKFIAAGRCSRMLKLGQLVCVHV